MMYFYDLIKGIKTPTLIKEVSLNYLVDKGDFIRIIGIDPGTHISGYGLIDVQLGDVFYLDHGAFKARPKDNVSQRLHTIGQKLEELLLKFKPDVAVLEKSFVGNNPRTAIALGEARGMLLYLLAKHHIDIKEFAACAIKKGISGNGRASKKDIHHLMSHLLKDTDYCINKKPIDVPLDISELDATDALAMAFYYGRSNTFQLEAH